MAKENYFLTRHKPTGNEVLVCAPKAALALATVLGQKEGNDVRPATADEVFSLASTLHPASVGKGEGKFFVQGQTLIRSKNAAAALASINEADYEVTQLDHDEVFEHGEKQTPKLVYQAPAKPERKKAEGQNPPSAQDNTPSPQGDGESMGEEEPQAAAA